MLNQLTLPKRAVRITVSVATGERLNGKFFLPCNEEAGTPEALLDFLNDKAMSFVPLQTINGIMFLSRTGLQIVRLENADGAEALTFRDRSAFHPMRLVLRGQPRVDLDGRCYTGTMPPDQREPSDLLNGPDNFILLNCNGNFIVVNKEAISHSTAM